MTKTCAVILAVLALSGCDSTGPDDGNVAIRFRGSAGVAASAQIVGTDPGPALVQTFSGVNGTLTIQSIHVVVGKFKLEGSEEACPDRAGEMDDDGDDEFEDCGDFKAAPFLLELPLNGGVVSVKSADVPAGAYDELEFEVEDADMDDDDDEAPALTTARNQMLALHADWPKEASMVVVGTFTPTGGTARSFRTFIDAEVEIEIDLVPPLVVGDDRGAEVTVVLDPAMWFRTASGAVLDLSAFNGPSRRLKLEVELEKGFTKVEIERH
jgi:hypothetical protein